jgi:hypothetical protein
MKNESNTYPILWKSFWSSFLIVAGASVLGVVAGCLIARKYSYNDNEVISKVVGYVGLMIVFWAAIFTKDWCMQSSNNGTKPELWYQRMYRSLAFIGTMLCAIPITWSLVS